MGAAEIVVPSRQCHPPAQGPHTVRQGPGPAAQGGHQMTKGEIQAFHITGLDTAAQTYRLQHRLQSRSFAAEHLGVDLFELTPHLHFAKLTVQQ